MPERRQLVCSAVLEWATLPALNIALNVALVIALPGCRADDSTAAPDRIVLIVIDTLRRDHVSAYGDPARLETATPHIDALAARGQTFRGATSSYHMTTMSMASLFTGHVPSIDTHDPKEILWAGQHWCGLERFAAGPEDSCVPLAVKTLGEEMSAAGYATIGIASNPLTHRPAGFDQGFDVWIDLNPMEKVRVYGSKRSIAVKRRAADRVLEALDQELARRASDHFFLYVHLMDVHDYLEGHQLKDGVAAYRRGVARADAAVGQILVQLEEEDLLEGATIVLTSDHGERLGEKHPLRGTMSHGGNPTFEYLISVPLIISPPLPAKLSNSNQPLRGQDVFVLLLALAGVPRSPEVSKSELGIDEIYLSERVFQTYRKGSWKIMRSREDASVVLFDLEVDALETRDVSHENPSIVATLESSLDAIANRLAATKTQPNELSDDDRELLRVLGYEE